MPVRHDDTRSVIDLALQSLQEERSACVRRLEAVLADSGATTEVEGYLRRIENINASLVRLAGAHVLT
ncbi:MAG: hypothetical protein AB7O57_24245 [Hyphomicrobiaceae bacterium]